MKPLSSIPKRIEANIHKFQKLLLREIRLAESEHLGPHLCFSSMPVICRLSILSMISRGFSHDVSPHVVLEKEFSNDERCAQFSSMFDRCDAK